ncbi:TPA: hypothetical protein HA244_06510 [Candidatus Micrarchaeota archaeon]|nr:hypothetical protein [Candidatus Micrarchaeota archaeon]
MTAAGVRGYRGWFFIPWNVGVTPDGRKVFFEVCRDNQANIETRVSVRNYGHNFPPDKARRLRKIMREYKYLATRLTSKELKKRKNGTTEREEEGK